MSSDALLGLRGVWEFTAVEYEAMGGPRLAGERRYNVPPVTFQGHEWKVMLGTVNGSVYKIAACFETTDRAEANRVHQSALHYCSGLYGKGNQQEHGICFWKTGNGNVILQAGETAGDCFINLFLTSRAALAGTAGEALKNAVAIYSPILSWNPVEHSSQDNLRWCWLRAIEWASWPAFMSQPVAPLLLVILPWKGVVLSVVLSNVAWAICVRYRWVSPGLAYWGSLAVRLKWLTCPAVAVYWISQGSYAIAALAAFWPLLAIILAAIPPTNQVGRIQKMFLGKLNISSLWQS